MSELEIKTATGTIRQVDGKWFLFFSDGRKEGPFSSREAALKRERQIQFFKNRSKGEDEIIYLLCEDGEVKPILVKGSGEYEVLELSQAIEKYKDLIDFIVNVQKEKEIDKGNLMETNSTHLHLYPTDASNYGKCLECGKDNVSLNILADKDETIVLCNGCFEQKGYEKLDSTEITIAAEDIEIISEEDIDEQAFASSKQKKQKDLMYVRFILAHEGPNKNKDFFSRSALKEAAHTPVLKAITWEHAEPIIGTIYKSQYKEVDDSTYAFASDGKRARIECEAVVWKYRYPTYAKDMINRYSKNELKFSMETYFSQCTCMHCGEQFASKNHREGTYCEHLNYRKTDKKSKAYRALEGNTFGGAGVVLYPADMNADALAVAKNDRKEGQSVADKIELTPAELKERIDDAVVKALAEAEKKNKSAKELEKANAENEKLKAQFEEVKTSVKTLEEQRDSAVAELEEMKKNLESAKLIAARMRRLADAGYEIPESDEEKTELHSTVAEFTEKGFDLFVSGIEKTKAQQEKEEEQKEEVQEESEEASASLEIPSSTGKKKESDNKVSELTKLVGAFMDTESW